MEALKEREKFSFVPSIEVSTYHQAFTEKVFNKHTYFPISICQMYRKLWNESLFYCISWIFHMYIIDDLSCQKHYVHQTFADPVFNVNQCPQFYVSKTINQTFKGQCVNILISICLHARYDYACYGSVQGVKVTLCKYIWLRQYSFIYASEKVIHCIKISVLYVQKRKQFFLYSEVGTCNK